MVLEGRIWTCEICGHDYKKPIKAQECEAIGVVNVNVKVGTIFKDLWESDYDSAVLIIGEEPISKEHEFPGHYPIYHTLDLDLDFKHHEFAELEIGILNNPTNLVELSNKEFRYSCNVFSKIDSDEYGKFPRPSHFFKGRRTQFLSKYGGLQAQLDWAILKEMYEMAAQLRDEINAFKRKQRIKVKTD